MRLLILGGTSDHPGGLEAFRDRSAEALNRKDGWQIDRLPTNTAYLNMRRLPAMSKGLLQLLRHSVARRPDCVWLHYVNLPDLLYLMLARLLGLRVVVTPHLGVNWRSQETPFLRALSRWLLSRANRLAMMSHTQEVEIALPPGIPKSYIRNFLPPQVLNDRATERKPSAMQLIHSGRLSEGKGTFLFVDVCKELLDAGLPFHARITGAADEPTFERLHSKIEEYALQDHIDVLGRVADAVLFDTLHNSDVLIHLSRVDSYPLIVLEAIACGIMPVCMELAGARDMIETYGGHLVSTASPANETANLLTDRDLQEIRRTGHNASKKVRADYDWDRCADALSLALHACMEWDRRC